MGVLQSDKGQHFAVLGGAVIACLLCVFFLPWRKLDKASQIHEYSGRPRIVPDHLGFPCYLDYKLPRQRLRLVKSCH